jgi:hypothetical protein
MMQPIFSSLFTHYRHTIQEMPSRFTSHEFIARLAQENQREYIEALTAYRRSRAPFKVVHGILAKHLNAFPTLVMQDGPAIDADIFGDPCSCAWWRKI